MAQLTMHVRLKELAISRDEPDADIESARKFTGEKGNTSFQLNEHAVSGSAEREYEISR